MTLKEKTYRYYRELLNERISVQQLAMEELKTSAAGETKRTAGDKHETALAMLQAKQERLRTQLHELLVQKSVLEKINPLLTAVAVGIGSLVHTSGGCFYISAALGRAVVDGVTVSALSPLSPLGSSLLGLTPGGQVRVNNREYIIERVE